MIGDAETLFRETRILSVQMEFTAAQSCTVQVKEGAGDFMDFWSGSGIKRDVVVEWCLISSCKLDFLAIDQDSPWVRGELQSCEGFEEATVKCPGNVLWHQDVNIVGTCIAYLVIP